MLKNKIKVENAIKDVEVSLKKLLDIIKDSYVDYCNFSGDLSNLNRLVDKINKHFYQVSR